MEADDEIEERVMNTFLADGWHGGPGPWILLMPLVWIGAIVLVRRIFFRGRGGAPWFAAGGPRPGWQAGPGRPGRPQGWTDTRQGPAPSPLETLNRRYADGEIDEFEYRQRLDVLNGEDSTPQP
ncbi:putative membrane protein [Streptacidiphilus sp. BW17]|uniref:SHOCT domain-containing protein n=2 Tax=Streptacidiphilus TaxID=228398 RepID=UPI0035122CFB